MSRPAFALPDGASCFPDGSPQAARAAAMGPWQPGVAPGHAGGPPDDGLGAEDYKAIFRGIFRRRAELAEFSPHHPLQRLDFLQRHRRLWEEEELLTFGGARYIWEALPAATGTCRRPILEPCEDEDDGDVGPICDGLIRLVGWKRDGGSTVLWGVCEMNGHPHHRRLEGYAFLDQVLYPMLAEAGYPVARGYAAADESRRGLYDTFLQLDCNARQGEAVDPEEQEAPEVPTGGRFPQPRILDPDDLVVPTASRFSPCGGPALEHARVLRAFLRRRAEVLALDPLLPLPQPGLSTSPFGPPGSRQAPPVGFLDGLWSGSPLVTAPCGCGGTIYACAFTAFYGKFSMRGLCAGCGWTYVRGLGLQDADRAQLSLGPLPKRLPCCGDPAGVVAPRLPLWRALYRLGERDLPPYLWACEPEVVTRPGRGTAPDRDERRPR